MPAPNTTTETDEAVAAVLPTIRAVARWLEQPRRTFTHHRAPVHLAFSPGDGTCYSMLMVPPVIDGYATTREHKRIRVDEAVMVVLMGTGSACVVNPSGTPWPDYVAEHLGTRNRWTIAAVGVVWALMVGCSPAKVALAYSTLADVVGSWDTRAFTVAGQ